MPRALPLLFALSALGCTATLDLDERADADDPGVLTLDAGPEPDLADAPKLEDAGAPDAEPDGPPCVDGDGDGYGEGCAAGPDCDDGDPGVSPGAAERCNGVDDDCDGALDERWPDVRRICTGGRGTCARPGMWICAADGQQLDCDFTAGDPQPETCNGLDDDCDGEADEGVDGCCQPGQTRPCGSNVGDCTVGEQRCDEALRWTACSGRPPADELCDGADQDCDGQVDEGAVNACGDCGAAPAEVCDQVDQDCDGLIDEGVSNPCGGCGAVPRERCDAVDNDCDGQVDEGLPLNACGACGRPPVEVCDDVDQDCDGQVDEGVCAPMVDACEAPAVLSLGEAVTGPMGGAPALHSAGCGAGGRGPEVAFQVTLPPLAQACATTEGSDFDTVLHVRSACADAATAVACNDDTPGLGLRSRVSIPADAPRTLFVFVDSYPSQVAAGTWQLQVDLNACE